MRSDIPGETERFCPSNTSSLLEVSSRSTGSPNVVPYCKAERPVLVEPRIPANRPRASRTGSDSWSVKPAAKEINWGCANVVAIIQEMGGSAVRRPSLERASDFMYQVRTHSRYRGPGEQV